MTKINIISGFLGAGKTTLIRKLLGGAFENEKLVLLENEYGEVGIDGGFMKDSGIQVTELNSGCICCTMVGDFSDALKELIDNYHPDRIIIEPSGVGKLSDIRRVVTEMMEEYEIMLQGSATVADVNKCRMYARNFGEFFIDQIETAETIILSRTQTASEDRIEKCIELLRQYNADARIITTPWDELTPAQMLEVIESAKALLSTEEALHEHHHHHDGECCCGHHGHEHHHDHECECGHDHEHHHHDHECECGHHGHERHHDHECECGYDHEYHDHDHECECGHDHEYHDHDHECECGHDHEHHHHDHECECGHDHEHHRHDHECECGHHDHEHHHHDHECECGHHGHEHHHDHECECGHHDHEHHHDHECECGHHDHEHHHHEHGEGCTCGCGHDHHGHHHADEVFQNIGVETHKKFSENQIREALEALDDGETYGAVLRAKGIVPTADGEWLHFDYVPGEYEIRSGSADYTGRLCVIGAGIREDKIRRLFGI